MEIQIKMTVNICEVVVSLLFNENVFFTKFHFSAVQESVINIQQLIVSGLCPNLLKLIKYCSQWPEALHLHSFQALFADEIICDEGQR